jgi:uncharacterized membrane protein
MFFSPFTFFFVLAFFLSLLLLFFVIQINLITLAFAQIGIPSQYIFYALLASLFGSFINIPVKTIPQEHVEPRGVVSYFGFRHVIPIRRRSETVLAVLLSALLV